MIFIVIFAKFGKGFLDSDLIKSRDESTRVFKLLFNNKEKDVIKL